MTSGPLLERQIPAMLEDLYLGPTPEYASKVIRTAVGRRQRPRWAFVERWFPMTDVTARRVIPPALPWRAIALALLLLALAIGGVLIAGSRNATLPAPFGIARNGLLAYANDGDVFTLDPMSGLTAAVMTGPETDREPEFSPDGTHIAFRRIVPGAGEAIVVVRADGSGAITITEAPIAGGFKRLDWAPDSNSLIATTESTPSKVVLFETTRANQPRVIAEHAEAYPLPFRPPSGSVVLVRRVVDNDDSELVAVDLASGRTRTLVTAIGGRTGEARWSPDGSRIAYDANSADDPDSHRIFIADADSGTTRQVSTSPGTWYEVGARWSPDGTHLAFTGWRADRGFEISPIQVFSLADGSIRGVGPLARDVRRQAPTPDEALAPANEGFYFEWSPDATALVAIPTDASAHPILIHLQDGAWRLLDPIVDTDERTTIWQRMAP